MPRQRKRGPRRKGGSRIDTVHYPLVYSLSAGQEADTSVKSLYETFDRRRAFRIAALSGEFSASIFPVLVSFQLYSPVSKADNIWTSRLMVVPTGVVRKFRFRIPVTANSWYPSDTSATTILMKLIASCTDKTMKGHLTGTVYCTIQMRPLEWDSSCPTMMQTRPSGSLQFDATSSKSSIEVLSSDEEYFSA